MEAHFEDLSLNINFNIVWERELAILISAADDSASLLFTLGVLLLLLLANNLRLH